MVTVYMKCNMFNLIINIVFSLQLGKELTCMRLAGYDKIDWCLKLFHINKLLYFKV